MNWYSIDAIDAAIKRTKKVLIEPFDFWKWIRLGIICILIGNSGIWNGYNLGNFDRGYEEKEGTLPQTGEIINQISQFWQQYQTYILIGLAVIIFIILLFGLISSIMEFILVESLVTNVVTIRAYFRKYLHPGFNLFVIQTLLGIFFLSLFILAMIPILLPLLESPGAINFGKILMAIFWFIAVLLVLGTIGGILSSFIGLSIPLVMYDGIGIIAAIKKILGKFKADWRQIIVYWVLRIILGLAAGIIVGIAALILFIVLFIIILVPGLILYFVLSGLGHGTQSAMFWTVMLLYGLIAVILLILFILIVSVPVPVFMKYHMLTFLQMWYPDVRIPFHDSKESVLQ